MAAGYKAICVDREILEVLVFANNSWEKSCCSIRKVIMRYYDYLAVADLLNGAHNVFKIVTIDSSNKSIFKDERHTRTTVFELSVSRTSF